ncbi:hypothetical protein RI367_000932 [Sorochytrium milnesiophthora]
MTLARFVAAAVVAIVFFPFVLTVLLVLAPAVLVASYAVTTCIYLLFAQTDRASVWPLLVWHPRRVVRIAYEALRSTLGLAADPIARQHVRLFTTSIASRLQGKALSEHHDRKTIAYGTHRCKLDIYSPRKHKTGLSPVVVFIYGGAWNTGSKWLYSPLARQLAAEGNVVVIPDYTLYPTARVDHMMNDVALAIRWTQQNVSRYGGDRHHITLMGHSAGAHLSLMTLLANALKSTAGHSFTLPPLDAKVKFDRLHACVLLAGVYDIPKHLHYERRRDVHEVSGMRRACGGSQANMAARSPALFLQHWSGDDKMRLTLRDALPPTIVTVHGDGDKTVPLEQSARVHRLLHEIIGDGAHLLVPRGRHHTDVVADLMQESPLLQDILPYLL